MATTLRWLNLIGCCVQMHDCSISIHSLTRDSHYICSQGKKHHKIKSCDGKNEGGPGVGGQSQDGMKSCEHVVCHDGRTGWGAGWWSHETEPSLANTWYALIEEIGAWVSRVTRQMCYAFTDWRD